MEKQEIQSKYLNRELSWLAFNERVLEEASNISNPLLERVKFLSISCSNLDEFFMIRVAGLKEHVRNNMQHISIDGLPISEQLRLVEEKSTRLINKQENLWQELQDELKQNNIEVAKIDELTKDELAQLNKFFLNNIFPVLSPISVDQTHLFPFIPNAHLALMIEFSDNRRKLRQAIILLPTKLPRFVKIEEEKNKFVLLEEVIIKFINDLFSDITLKSWGIFRVIRDGDLDIEDDAEDLMRHMENAVMKRRKGALTRLEIGQMPGNLLGMVVTKLLPEDADIAYIKPIIGLKSISELYACPRDDLKFPPYAERFPERINDFNGDCFAAIAAKDIVIHHPYESFDVVVKFLQQAASDPDVVAIKQTLYRTSNDSPIVKALIEAAEAGKAVTVCVELKARFDEEANLKWARNLEKAGAQVVFGFIKLKTHAKVSLVVRREANLLKSYVHFGTGNYHPVTAKIYSDLSYFTCDSLLCQDASYLFNFLTGDTKPHCFNKLVISPFDLRNKLIELIDDEINFAKEGKPANIWVKLNSLIDTKIIDKLYEASSYGVKIYLVIRGICGLKPQVKGLSENIYVKSIVGRFLEHSRIMCFGNGNTLPSINAKVFISSADWMTRNFDYRVEVLVPIENPTVHAQIMGQIMNANFEDKQQSWVMQPDGNYIRENFEENSFNAHKYFMQNPSLSGRGKASVFKNTKESSSIYKLFNYKDSSTI